MSTEPTTGNPADVAAAARDLEGTAGECGCSAATQSVLINTHL